ncbi:MAG: divergent polysaccharide deacetylase family protein [Calditrichaeota bacterium]|nr:MAG: divergent polysaccharide deacetylase family protein [Calditrichota bacterium]
MARRTKKKEKHTFIYLIFTMILSGVLFVVAVRTGLISLSWLDKKTTQITPAFPLSTEISKILLRNQIPAAAMNINIDRMQIAVPQKIHPAVLYHAISGLILKKDGRIISGQQTDSTGTAQLQFNYKSNQTFLINFVPDRQAPTGPKIAIVIDDFGYNRGKTVQQLIGFPYSITYSVIPGLPKSEAIAKELFQLDKTIFIHLPMEPMQGRVESEGYTLFTNLEAEEIRIRVQKAIAAVPHAKGLNNHMGSKATADSATITPALEEIKKANLIFLDSRTSPQSVAYKLAGKMQMTAYLNNAFIDAVDEKEAITQKMQRLAKQAKKDGLAIGIGHPRAKTLAVLSEMMPKLAEQGFVFVVLGRNIM